MNMKYLGISQLERLKKPKNLNSHNLDDLYGEEKNGTRPLLCMQ